ncbi:hypothetical protein O7635_04395 [Asanoa sp. WMMD1127]|uniref:hypothetical protein n=1 Tax=Asanoa sp. WMMD1127 TaxID=3016107 RepID=UPI0024170D78|nr:hypothetical protein [Asanoa sp. WMMD1127]MDG4821093.1 hypothetical protein [Asanoa sp. WMMD1127]
MTAADLERRYRRLLRLFPRRHRADYEAEMLAALLAAADEGQRFPRRGEVADLARAALAAHTVGRLGGSAWPAAAGVVGTIGAIGMSAGALRGAGIWHGLFDASLPIPFWLVVLVFGQLGLWLLAAVAAVAGWRGLAVVAAGLGLVGETAFGVWIFGVERVPIAVVAAVVTTGSLAVWLVGAGSRLRGRPLAAAVAAGAIGILTGWLPRAEFAATVPWLPIGRGWRYEAGGLGLLAAALVGSLLVAAVLAQRRGVRWRAAVLALPVAAVVLASNAISDPPPTLLALLLLAAPFAGLGLARGARRATDRRPRLSRS